MVESMQVCAWGLDPQVGAAATREGECLLA